MHMIHEVPRGILIRDSNLWSFSASLFFSVSCLPEAGSSLVDQPIGFEAFFSVETNDLRWFWSIR